MNEIKRMLNFFKKPYVMKRLLVVFFAIFALAIFFIGCQESFVDPTPPVESPIKYVFVVKSTDSDGNLTVNAGKNLVPQGSRFDLKFNVKPGYQAVINSNGETVSTEDSEYNITKSAKEDCSIDVSFEKTGKWQLMQHDWKTDHWITTSYPDFKEETSIPTKIYVWHFEKDSVYQTNVMTGKLEGNMPYHIKGDSISFGKGTGITFKKITELNDSVFSYKGVAQYYDVETGKMDPSKNGTLEIVTKKVTK